MFEVNFLSCVQVSLHSFCDSTERGMYEVCFERPSVCLSGQKVEGDLCVNAGKSMNLDVFHNGCAVYCR